MLDDNEEGYHIVIDLRKTVSDTIAWAIGVLARNRR